jgi:hypothetical protein
LFGVLNIGRRLASCERILLGYHSPHPLSVASLVLQLVSEQVRSLVVLN